MLCVQRHTYALLCALLTTGTAFESENYSASDERAHQIAAAAVTPQPLVVGATQTTNEMGLVTGLFVVFALLGFVVAFFMGYYIGSVTNPGVRDLVFQNQLATAQQMQTGTAANTNNQHFSLPVQLPMAAHPQTRRLRAVNTLEQQPEDALLQTQPSVPYHHQNNIWDSVRKTPSDFAPNKLVHVHQQTRSTLLDSYRLSPNKNK